jgi:hypothetical protein
VRLDGAYLVGAGRLGLRYPTDRFESASLETGEGVPGWLVFAAPHGDHAEAGLVNLMPVVPAYGPMPMYLEMVLHLKLRPGATAGGELRLIDSEFSGPDGVMLVADLGEPARPLGDAPARFELSRPWPNPARGEMSVQLSMVHEARVEVGVYDLSGRRVATLHDGRLPAGVHTLRWDGRGERDARVAGGVYFVRARCEGQETAQKTVLVERR